MCNAPSESAASDVEFLPARPGAEFGTAQGGLLAPPLRAAWPIPTGLLPARADYTLSRGYTASAFVYPPVGQALSPVIYVHGIQSHPGWFTRSCAALAQAGHPVLAITRRGSGDAMAARGHADSPEMLLADIDAAIKLAGDLSGAAKPVHLVGVSWGGKLLAAYCLSGVRANKVASLTLVAPGIVPQVDVSWRIKLAIAAALVYEPRRRFAIPLNHPELFTDNAAMQHYLKDDPARLHEATAAFYYASKRLDARLSRAAAGSLAVPTTLMLARRDRIIDNVRTRAAVERLTGGRARVLTFDAAHTLDFEADPSAFLDALVGACSG